MTDEITQAPPPRDDLYRAMPGGVTSSDGRTLEVRLAPAETWTEIDSAVEGRFMERFSRSAYRKTMAERRPKILFQHGKDPEIGEKPIATTDELGEDETSPFARGEILDGVPALVVDGLRKGVYGASHRFSVVREDWVPKPKASAHNPLGLPERTITEARLYELGPVTWPAYASASATLRSLTDEMRGITPPEPEAPSLDAEAPPEPHLEPERRDEPEAVEAAQQEEPTVEYVTIDEKEARVREITEDLSTLAGEHPGVMPADAQKRWDALTTEADELRADISAYRTRAAKLAEIAGSPANTERAYSVPTFVRTRTESDIYDLGALRGLEPEDRSQALRDNAMRSVEQAVFPHERADQDGAKEFVQRLLDTADSDDKELARRILTTGSPQYRRAFNRYLSSGGTERGTALAVGVDGTGGFAVPYAFDPSIIATGAHTSINPFRAACRTVTITGTDTWRALTANAVVAAYVTEAYAATEQGPTFTRPEIIVLRAQSYVTMSYEMLEDRPDLSSELAVLFQEAKDNVEESKFSVGSGSGEPTGMGYKGSFTKTGTATNDTTAVGDLLLVEAALPIRHRMNGAWFLSRAAIRAIQAWETTGGQLFNSTAGYPAVGNIQRATNGNTGLTLLGYPVWETPSMPWTPTTDDTVAGVFGDPRNYVIVDRVGMSVKLIPDLLDATTGLPTGQHGLYAYWRNNAAPVNADGMRQLVVE